MRSMILPSEGAEGEGKEKTFMQPVSESRGGGVREVWCFEWCEGRDGPLEERFL